MRVTKAGKQRCAEAVNAIVGHVRALGAEELPNKLESLSIASAEFRLQTEAGPLWINPNTNGQWLTIFGRFEDAKAARVYFGFDADKYNIFAHGRLAPHTGKWNFHSDDSNELWRLVDQFKRELALVGPLPVRQQAP